MLLGWHVALVLRVCMTPAGRGNIPWDIAIGGQTRGILLLPMSLHLNQHETVSNMNTVSQHDGSF